MGELQPVPTHATEIYTGPVTRRWRVSMFAVLVDTCCRADYRWGTELQPSPHPDTEPNRMVFWSVEAGVVVPQGVSV